MPEPTTSFNSLAPIADAAAESASAETLDVAVPPTPPPSDAPALTPVFPADLVGLGGKELLQRLQEDMQQRWKRGERFLAEFYREQVPSLRDDAEVFLELVCSEVMLRRQSGETPDLDEYCRRSPEHAEALRRLLDLRHRPGNPPGESAEVTVDTMPAPTYVGPSKEAKAPGPVPGYEILSVLGRGGMGVVYKARHLKLNRIVALKMILSAAHASLADLRRFVTEAEAVARVQHPNVVQIFEVGGHEGRPFLSLEYCPGGSLDKKLAGSPVHPGEAAQLVRLLADAMQAAHQANVIHRDLKPANVLLTADKTPKITDFGLAKKLDESGQTQTGAVMGTPSYMAPEQAEGNKKAVGPATDVYALGAILYECLTGRPPFKADTVYDTILQVMRQDPVPPRQLNPKVPVDLETICLKCLEKTPARRYASASALADELTRFQTGKPVLVRPVGKLARAWRWCQRNPTVAASLLVVVFSLVTASAVSIWFGLHAEQARQDEANRAQSEAAAKRDAEQAHQAEAERTRTEAAAKREAEKARRDAQRQLIDLSGATGLAAAEQGDDSLALLWFARSVHLARDEPDMQELGRARYSNWRRRVWLPETTFAVPGFRQAQDRFNTFTFSPDGAYLLVIAGNGACLVWDRLQSRLVDLPAAARQCTAAAWAPKSSLLAVGGENRHIRFLQPPAFQPTDEEVPADDSVTVLAFSRDGERVAWGSSSAARVWDRSQKEFVTPVLAHPQAVRSLSFSAAGHLLATSAADSRARVFQVASDKQEPLFPAVTVETLGQYGTNHGGSDGVAPRFADNDRALLTVERNSLVWRSATTGQPQFSTGAAGREHGLSIFAVNPEGDRVVVSGDPVALIDARTHGAIAAVPCTNQGWLEEMTFSEDGHTLVTCNQLAQFWSVENRTNFNLVATGPGISAPMVGVRAKLTPDGKALAVAHWDGTVYLWRLPEGPPVAYSVPSGQGGLAAFSPDGRLLLPQGNSYRNSTLLQTRAYHADSGMPAGPVLDPGGIVIDAAFSPDGTKVALACLTARTPAERLPRIFEPDGKAGNVQIWDWKTGKRLTEAIPLPSEPRSLAFRPDGAMLAVICADYFVVLVDPTSGSITRKLDPGIRSRPQDANHWVSNGEVRFSPDGRFLVTWEMASAVHVWDAEDGRLLHSLPHNGRVAHVSFSPVEPGLMATAGRDNVARIWDLAAGRLRAQLPHPTNVSRARFSLDGAELLTSSGDGILRAWDWRAGKLKEALPRVPDGLHDFAFTADRRWLFDLGWVGFKVIDWRTKASVGPTWSLRGNLAVEIPRGDRRAIVGGFSGSLVAYDLEAMVKPAAGPAESLVEFAEIVAGRRILPEGNVAPLSNAEWAERWQRLQQAGFPRLPDSAPVKEGH